MGDNEFDYVVVGGGSGGAAVAARLSEDPAVTVCLLEAGPSDIGDDAILRLDRWMELLESGYDWDYPIEPQASGNSHMRHARAKVLGGCSSHNSCIAFWAPREDLDSWEYDHGAAGWGADSVYRLYAQLETNDAPGAHHGRTGPVHVMTVQPNDPCGVAVLDACEEIGIPRTEFNSGRTVMNGANFFQINRRADGIRSSSSVSYLHPHQDRENLTIRTGAWAKRILTEIGDGGTRAVGVELTDNAFGRSTRVAARREVIVAAGAIDSPKLLMLSGIGPADHLRENGIDVLIDSPGVGMHLQDHPEGVIGWETTRPMVRESTQWWEAGIFTTTARGLDRPDLMMHYGSVPFDMHTLRQGYPTASETFCLTPNVTHARSRGTVRLRSRDFRDKPRVDPRYFTDAEGHDMRVMIAGIRKAREIASATPLSGWIERELYPGPGTQSDAELADYIRRTHNTVYHPVGTVRMGAPEDPLSPLDPQLRVKGVDGLRVADASVFPEHTTVNPNLTVMLVGERCAELVAADR
ncbi:GMC family oxidoreductase N-terminal domain-containing protein [Tsukamurella sp. 8F]|uniref:GMC family oxidoreductase n=1 Tax=unclassified Tsukamurella TaxID=2633480 RepID=UPI0023B913CE|nr:MULTISPECIES: GMC oxidoreductase [unclassified Tsukamurella]MDF0532253.1 GMC family oxidoreductase N-terminal domain-containing protein [Tsukamurella sp. 8J]MDF0589493.1 GMC family oxidoreductase N-terminal domain-containing protein [Tsukamurella sp. 8F]